MFYVFFTFCYDKTGMILYVSIFTNNLLTLAMGGASL